MNTIYLLNEYSWDDVKEVYIHLQTLTFSDNKKRELFVKEKLKMWKAFNIKKRSIDKNFKIITYTLLKGDQYPKRCRLSLVNTEIR